MIPLEGYEGRPQKLHGSILETALLESQTAAHDAIWTYLILAVLHDDAQFYGWDHFFFFLGLDVGRNSVPLLLIRPPDWAGWWGMASIFSAPLQRILRAFVHSFWLWGPLSCGWPSYCNSAAEAS